MPINKFLYFGDFFAIPVALAAFAWLAFETRGHAAAPAYGLGLAAGVFVWTFAEYWIHRTLYHRAPWLSELHDRHHEAPSDYFGVPSFVSSGIVIVIAYAPFYAVWPTFADGFVSGVLIGYAAYMIVHHATHHWAIAPSDWLYAARVRHLGHHYHDDIHFGVVTGFWDRIFGTAGRRPNRLAGV
jgi:sterol desaturase/sphingolipid hydroxylase (fatty acid hydroxylase superfamily)